jgi:hypothetical protein
MVVFFEGKFVRYPVIGSPNFLKTIANKYEFNRFGPDKNLTCNTNIPFQLKSFQKLAVAYISPNTPYNGLLLFHNTGTGKTSTSITIAEQFNEVFKKKHLVICKTNLIDNFKKEIRFCTGGSESRYNEKKKMNERWEFISDQKLSNKYKEYQEQCRKRRVSFDERLSEIFSNRVIIIDEAHNIRQSKTELKSLPKELSHIIRVSRNVKLILLTATPMYDNASEIVFLLNLLLENDNKKPIKESRLFSHDRLLDPKTLEDMFMGYVSVKMDIDPSVFPDRLYPTERDLFSVKDIPKHGLYTGKPLPHGIRSLTNLSLVKTKMSPLQEEALQYLLKTRNFEIDGDIHMHTEFTQLLQVSNVVFPMPKDMTVAQSIDMFTGNKGFEFAFRKSQGKFFYKNNSMQFLDQDNIHKYAPKLATIVDCIKGSKGIVFVYSRYIKTGIAPLAIALEHLGFNKYSRDGKNTNILGSAIGSNPHLGSYIMLNSESKENIFEINMARSEANVNGDIIKVILGTSVAVVGHDYKNIREVHLVEPWYNFGLNDQVFGRGIRHCSHTMLPPKERNVTLYQHACVYSSPVYTSIDLYNYALANNKQTNVNQVTEILKKCSIESQVQKTVIKKIPKVVITSQGIRRVVNIDTPVVVRNKIHVDRSTYDTSFATHDIDMLKNKIIQCFQSRVYFSYADLKRCVCGHGSDTDEELFITALDTLLKANNGFKVGQTQGHLVYASNKYIFQQTADKNPRTSLEDREEGIIPQITVTRVPFVKVQSNVHRASSVSLEDGILAGIDKMGHVLGDMYRDAIVDFLIDRLRCEDQMQLFMTCTNTVVMQRLMALPHLFEGRYFVDFETSNIFVLNAERNFEKCSPYEKVQVEKIQKAMAKTLGMRIKETKGYLAYEKRTFRFKILTKPNISMGSVCETTSSFDKVIMTSLIHALDPSLVFPKVAKRGLCDIYEVLLRKFTPSLFLRPLEHKLAVEWNDK